MKKLITLILFFLLFFQCYLPIEKTYCSKAVLMETHTINPKPEELDKSQLFGLFNQKLNEVVPALNKFFTDISAEHASVFANNPSIFDTSKFSDQFISKIEGIISKIKINLDTQSGKECSDSVNLNLYDLQKVVKEELPDKVICTISKPTSSNNCTVSTIYSNHSPPLVHLIDDLYTIFGINKDGGAADICEAHAQTSTSGETSTSSGGGTSSSSSGSEVLSGLLNVPKFKKALDGFQRIMKRLSRKYPNAVGADQTVNFVSEIKRGLKMSPQDCTKIVSNGVNDLRRVELENLACTGTETVPCIPKGVVEQATVKLKASFSTIQSIASVDKNNDGITDICE